MFFVIVSFLLSILTAAASTQAPSQLPLCRSGSAEAESPAIERTIRAWYAAEEENDIVAWHAQLLPNFYLFDEGIRRSGDALFAIVGPAHQRQRQRVPDRTVELEFRDLHVQADCNAAIATYNLRAAADSQKLGKHSENVYLESAWLTKEDGRWRISFSQTTRISQPVRLPPSGEEDADGAAALSPAPTVDAKSILEALRAWYAAIGAGDVIQFRAQIMPDFYIFDEGKRFTGDELIQITQEHLADGWKTGWTISSPEISVDRNMAIATFTTLRSYSDVGHEQKTAFLESAVLRRTDGQWRIAFFHRTKAPKQAVAAALRTSSIEHSIALYNP